MYLDGNPGLQVVRTPGHTLDSVSVLVNTDEGWTVVAGDTFEREEDVWDHKIWRQVEMGIHDGLATSPLITSSCQGRGRDRVRIAAVVQSVLAG